MYNLAQRFLTFSTTLIITIIIDVIIIYYVVRPFFGNSLTFIMRPTVNYTSALASWALLVLGIMVFVHGTQKNISYTESILQGALWGFFVYGVYETTNFALINSWPFHFFLFDWAWGTMLSAIISLFICYMENKS